MGIRDALNDGEHAEILAAGGGVHNALLLDDIRECLLNLLQVLFLIIGIRERGELFLKNLCIYLFALICGNVCHV